MMKKGLFLLLVGALLLGSLGCDASDPWTEDWNYSGHSYRYTASGGGGYWHQRTLDGISLSPGNSGATIVPPNISTLGGYRLDALGEWLYFDVYIGEDYDGVSDAVLDIFFEVNVDNSGGNDTDTVDFQIEYWCKRLGERTNTNATYNVSTTVGKAEQHDLFMATKACTPIGESLVAFRVELTTITSDVDNIIVNYVRMRYPTYAPALEVS